jgi:hypothetical protein
MKPGVVLFFEQHNAIAALHEQRCGGRPGGAAANYENVGVMQRYGELQTTH